jgi:rhodanese-related sulfurtransferase
VAQQLRQLGVETVALDGGFDAWRERFPIDPVSAAA